MEPDASSSATIRSGLRFLFLNLRSIGSPAARDRAPQRRAQVDAPALAAGALPPRHAGAHRAREPFGERQRLLALRPGRETREVLPGERFLRRRATLASPPFAGCLTRRLGLRALGKSVCARSAGTSLETAGAIWASKRRDRRMGALDAAPAPEGVEQFVEALVFAPVGRQQGFQRSPQTLGAIGERACDHARGVASLAAANGEARAAQCPGKARKPPAHADAKRCGARQGGGHAARPASLAVTSGVTRALSS